MSVDYGRVGLKVGLEIHRQLNTIHKLFCNCPTDLSREEEQTTFLRRLRPTQSELGQMDPAVLFEFNKGRTASYGADDGTSCLVEMDEEPPHPLNREAVEAGLLITLMFNAHPVDEIHIMRKVVIDGSNTTGFQRTCVIALGGWVEVDGKRISLQAICLEEDAARKMEEKGATVHYRIDRLGVPLIELATSPEIHTPQEAEKVALAMGRILRASGRVKRGLGTIRQDLNISILGGALIEVKGVQKLELISKTVALEVQRQTALLTIKGEIEKRGLREGELNIQPKDVTEIFLESQSKLVRDALKREGRVLAIKLPKFGGLLGRELQPNRRLGTEMAERAKFWGGVGGIFHTDELPAYGITQAEVERTRKILGAGDLDAVILVADEAEKAAEALKAVVERAREALLGVPSETRAANPDGTTRYMRPRPGAARMYPETDVPPLPVDPGHLEEVKAKLPPLPDFLIKRIMEQYGVNQKLAVQLMDSDWLPFFETATSAIKIPPTFIATTLTETLKSLDREGIPVDRLQDEQILGVFKLIEAGRIPKEALPPVITRLSEKGGNPAQTVEELGIRMLSPEEVREVIRAKVKDNRHLLIDQPNRAFDQLMRIVMGELRGRTDAKVVAAILKEEIEAASRTGH